jgi:serine/threonine protein kinase
MTRSDQCPRCGERLPADAPEESLCPQCLLKLGLDGPSGGADDAQPPTREGAAHSAERRPDRIGPYRILDTLGEGGMGIVYLAEQTEPVRRRVALKLIKLGMDTKQVIARFEAERQALALMNHANVAKVFDAGATEQGRPYFVMEYAPGIPITEYCDMRCLALQDRLALFNQVCEAIQHAHQKGIIHRDVKPTNVLVGTEDGKPQLKVIDFGVAKATSQRLTERTLYTRSGMLIGTPEYMSPEQAGTTALDVDTRTDIYSLGVLLYELLVGALPFDPKTLRQAAAVEMLRIIREEEPPKPTIKFGSLGDTASEIAKCRHTDVRSLAKQLRGELEWITMQALEKDPARRYASVSEFAADVRRYLDDDTVLAGPPSWSYRLGKFVKKNKGPVAAAVTLLATFAAATAISTTMYSRSEAARELAQAEALRNRLDAAALQAALLDDAAGYRERSREALEIHRAILDPDDPEYAVYLVNRWSLLSYMYMWEDDLEIEPLLNELKQESLEAVRNALPSSDPRIIEALDLVVHMDGWTTPQERAWACREALALRRKFSPDDPSLLRNLTDLADLVVSRSRAHRSRGDAPEADLLENEALDLLRETLQRRRGSAKPGDPSLALTQEKLANLLDHKASRLLHAGDALAAEPLLRESLTLLEQALPDGSRRLATLHSRLGQSLMALERFPEAESILLQGYRALEGEFEGKSASFQMVAGTLAELYETWERPAEADRFESRLTRPAIISVRDLGPLQFGEDGPSRVAGRLGGFSTRLAERSLWIFSLTSADPSCETGRHQCSGSWSWTDDLHSADGIGAFQNGTDATGLLAEALPYTDEEAAYNRAHLEEDCVEDYGSAHVLRPRGVALDEARHRALVFYDRGIAQNPPWSFALHGTSIAVWTDPTRQPRRPLTAQGQADLFSAEEPAWGSGATVVGDDLYAYACQCNLRSTCPCLVARVSLGEALDRRAWRFHVDGGRWSANWRDAKPVMDGASFLTVHWNDYLDQYLAIHSVPAARTIALRTADRPEGPWSDARVNVVALAPPDPAWLPDYHALGHPEFAREGGRIEYLTYHHPHHGFWVGPTRLVEIEFRSTGTSKGSPL